MRTPIDLWGRAIGGRPTVSRGRPTNPGITFHAVTPAQAAKTELQRPPPPEQPFRVDLSLAQAWAIPPSSSEVANHAGEV